MALSAVIIALNEEKKLPACLESLRFADEIVVVDSGSSDQTFQIASAYTSKVYKRTFDNFSSQKNFAISQASSEWVLSIDADERVTPGLAEEIRRIISNKAAVSGYEIPRKTRLFGRVFSYSGLQSDRPLRLFKKNAAAFEGAVHERVRILGQVVPLGKTLEHVSFQTFSEYFRRLQFYTSLELPSAGQQQKTANFILRPFYRFFLLYFLRQGFRDGVEGFFYCVLSAYYEFLKRAKWWEKKGKAYE